MILNILEQKMAENDPQARGDKDSCAICLESMLDDSIKVLTNPCFHMFHARCIFMCLDHRISVGDSYKCPTCRTTIVPRVVLSLDHSN